MFDISDYCRTSSTTLTTKEQPMTIELDKYHPAIAAKEHLATLDPLPTATELVAR